MDDEAKAARPIPDPARLISLMKTGDETARLRAYRQVFGSDLGRFVLADILRSAGFGQPRGFDMVDTARAYTDGQNDLAIEIAAAAGFGPQALALLPLTETLEGQDHAGPDHRSDTALYPDDRSGDGHAPDPEF